MTAGSSGPKKYAVSVWATVKTMPAKRQTGRYFFSVFKLLSVIQTRRQGMNIENRSS
jgi:hypothetical protein